MEPDRDNPDDQAGEAEHQARVAEQVAALAHELFNMAREGNASTLAAYLPGHSMPMVNRLFGSYRSPR
ncbi:Putative ankyrin-like protein [Mycobacteroides abscessus]|nr:Putative ankyrin-like protein [Mycobacteroides abscessus]